MAGLSDMQQPTLEDAELVGERALLRPLSLEDVEPAFGMLRGCDAIVDWLVWEGPRTRADLLPHYSSWRRGDGTGWDYSFAIVDREHGTFAGCIGLRFRGHPLQADVGYWVAVDSWGRGLASDAVALATWLAFVPLRSVLCYALVFEGNEASRRVLLKSGYEQDALTTQTVKGRRQRSWHMALAREGFDARFGDWAPRRSTLRLSEAQ